MFYVEHFFDLKEVEHSLETGNTSQPVWSRQRRVLLTADDAAVFHEAKSQYSRYEFIGGLRNGSSIKNRGSSQGVFDMNLDLHLLIAADFIVCAYTSNSVDEMYSAQFTHKRWWRAIADFEREDVKLGDEVSIESTQWDGFVQAEWKLNGTRNIKLPAYLFHEIVETIL
ncbi:unnamed protein product [Dibothriocephalus latus]|uniref:Alpha-(1,6)-fucosyltransferase N- and catalytic domain-containing protein n=1 Tax=Dibothriocephalus latus TaxID=60516 RepID=A0A3P7NZY1_DIBLA|nr:unnamed protein product [Dibothriocephalus latus]